MQGTKPRPGVETRCLRLSMRAFLLLLLIIIIDCWPQMEPLHAMWGSNEQNRRLSLCRWQHHYTAEQHQ